MVPLLSETGTLEETDLQDHSFDEYLNHAAQAHNKVEDLLALVLKDVIQLSGSRVGVLALDDSAHDVVDSDITIRGASSSGAGGQIIRSASVTHFPPVREAIKTCLRAKPSNNLDHLLVLTDSSTRPVDEDSVIGDILDSPSSVWLQLSDERSPLGWIGLGSGVCEAYPEPAIEALQTLLTKAALALNRLLVREHAKRHNIEINLVGLTGRFLEFERKLKQAASHSRCPILIRGERGCGKELAAYAIHYFSRRREGPFISVLASAITESLQVDELFGHAKNSFTGAAAARKGKFLAAEGGTLFLDEVGDLPASLQVALLRALEHGEIQPVGLDLPAKVDVRVIAATNRDLESLVATGRIRADLYDRLNVIELDVPPLRERREDIPLLARYFLHRQCREMNRSKLINQALVCESCRGSLVSCASERFYEALQEYNWPGNVRELENLITRLSTMSAGEILDAQHLPANILKRSTQSDMNRIEADLTLDGAARRHIEKVLVLTGHNQVRAASMLGIPRTTLQAKMRRLNIRPECRISAGAVEFSRD